MTEKNKRQLRAEAMERLKNSLGARLKPDAAIIAIVGGRVGQSDWSLECDKLIDLLTDDDSHEERESYEERMYDVPVSDCPYCGCDRVVIHDYNDIYERPHSYRVEHVDEKEAFNCDCFESYYGFDSIEKAVQHADARNERRHIGGNAENEITAAEFDALDEHAQALERENAELRKLCGANDTLDVENDVRAPSVDANDGNATQDSRDSRIRKGLGYKDFPPHEPSEATKRFIEELDAELDSREKLEADALALVDNLRVYGWHYAGDAEVEIIGMLGRQADITRRETVKRQEVFCDTCESVTDEHANELQKRCDELQAKVDGYVEALEKLGCSVLANGTVFWPSDYGASYSELQKQMDELTSERDKLRDKVRHQSRQLTDTQNALENRNEEIKPRWKRDIKKLQNKIDELTIENSELCDEIAALNELRGELTRERDGYHEEKVRIEMELAQAQGLLSNVTHNHAAAKAKYERAQIDAKRAMERQEEAERKYDELLKKPPEGAWAERVAELEAERDEFRDRLGKVLDLAGEIGGLA